MKIHESTTWRKRMPAPRTLIAQLLTNRLSSTGVILFASMLLSGCGQLRDAMDGSIRGPFYESHNHHLANNNWPDEIDVVAVMPLAPGRGDQWTEQGVELMQQILTEELARFDLFEAITITPAKLHALTGTEQVRPHDFLPNKFPAIIAALDKQRTDRKVCDAVLFCEIDTFRPYPPLAVGWKFRLFNLETGEVVWAFDEVFNSGDPRVNNSVRRYMRTQRMTHMDVFRDSLVVDSPRVLARYSLTEALETMRKKMPKEIQQTADNSVRE